MTHHLTDKIEATKTELQAVVDEHNKLVEKKQELLMRDLNIHQIKLYNQMLIYLH